MRNDESGKLLSIMKGAPKVLGVLIIDDDASWSRLVRQKIERSLPESLRVVRWEATFALGVAALKEFHADAIILDLTLPDSEDPYGTAKRIPELLSKERPYHPPVTVMSGHFDQVNLWSNDLVVACLWEGAQSIYPKEEISVSDCVKEIVMAHARETIRAARLVAAENGRT
jgi:DNA-binding NarL/FixJ family response regulator